MDADIINYCKNVVRNYVLADSISSVWHVHLNEIIEDSQLKFKARIQRVNLSGMDISIGFNILDSSYVKIGRIKYINVSDFNKTWDDVRLIILQYVRKMEEFIDRFNSISNLIGMEIYP